MIEMSEYLEGSDLYRAIADAKDAGEGPEVFEAVTPEGVIGKANTWDRIVIYSEKFGYKIRRKSGVRSFTDENGKLWTWPEPVSRRLEVGTIYFFIDLASRTDGIGEDVWKNRVIDDIRLANGLVQKYIEASEQQLNALLAVLS